MRASVPDEPTSEFTVGAIEQAQKTFRNAASEAGRRLLVASDMTETSDLRRRELDADAVDRLLKELRARRRLPNLKGIRASLGRGRYLDDRPVCRPRSRHREILALTP